MSKQRVVVTGLGVVAPNAIGIPAFASALREGRSAFTSWRGALGESREPLPAALLEGFSFASSVQAHDASAKNADLAARAERIGRRSTRTVQVALLAALEAVVDAGLGPEDLARIGVIVAGHNLNQRTVFENAARFANAPEHLAPSYAMHCWDTDHVGAISELLAGEKREGDNRPSEAEGMTVGGASASGNVAIVHAMRLVRDGYLSSCLVVGAMTDLSPMEIGALESLGALAGVGEKYSARPSEACRPFDRDREGFVYGQSCACILLESLDHARARAVKTLHGEVLGGSVVLDGRRSTEPSAQGEASAMRRALADAHLEPEKIDYVNAHGTSSRIGDATELSAIANVLGADHLPSVWVNSTKGIVGHGLSAAGALEAVATLVQMRGGFIHPNKNLVNPLRGDGVRFAPSNESVAIGTKNDLAIAMSNSFGFGGFNSSIVLGNDVGQALPS